ncbi:metal ABC transporter permease [Haematomicrobium sanguinis]|uniref:metal ABC transporter permease n=1 Tax=Haematomicrobium sanguinis TaxID=479106 RepID=UPI00047C080E|nr:metal ABC transporter permease [Haematomicrobium sanguinis]
MNWDNIFGRIFNFDDFADLVPLVQNSLWAAVILGVVGGVFGVFVMMRDLAFAVHGIAELSFAGAAFALLIGADVMTGSLVGSFLAALLLGMLSLRSSTQNSVIGVLMPFGLGLGILFLSLYEGRAANKFGLLTGQIVAVDSIQLTGLIVMAIIALAILAGIWRPLAFASVDPVVAAARGVPTRTLGVLFLMLLAIAVALSIQVVGALLVLALLITPAAAALRVAKAPIAVVLLSTIFALTAMVGGILLSLGGTIPVSPYVTTISFVIYLLCRGIEAMRTRSLRAGRLRTAP